MKPYDLGLNIKHPFCRNIKINVHFAIFIPFDCVSISNLLKLYDNT